jgi:hypothetical protein
LRIELEGVSITTQPLKTPDFYQIMKREKEEWIYVVQGRERRRQLWSNHHLGFNDNWVIY